MAGADGPLLGLVGSPRFVKEPTTFAELGAHIPRGVLLVGRTLPEDGKTNRQTAETGSRDEVVDQTRPKYTSLLMDSLAPGAELLELGCGGNDSTTRQLADRFRLTGVDIAERQIALARSQCHTPCLFVTT
jgi:hypothetical protein